MEDELIPFEEGPETRDEYEPLKDGKPIKEVPGSTKNLEKLGAPSERDDIHIRYCFHPTWRSQIFPLIGYFITCVLCVWISGKVPSTVIKGPLFSVFGSMLYLHLPLLVLIPGLVLGKVLIYMYDSKYIIDERGVEAQIGLVSMSLRQPRLRYEDIRGVEPVQTLWERIIGIGGVLIGSAMTQDVEIVMEGVDNPRAIQLLIGGERDKSTKKMQQQGINPAAAMSGD